MNKRPIPFAPTESVRDITQSSYPHWLGELSRLRQESRMREGLYAGKPLNGYLRVTGIESHVVDEGKRKAIRRLFLEAPKRSYRELLQVAEEDKLAASGGARMGLSSLHNLLSNPFYAGMVRTREGLVRGKHESMVSPGEFEAAQNALAKRRC